MSNYRNTVFDWFLSKKKPNETQFRNVWTWLRWRDEKIPVQDVQGIDNLLLQKAEAQLVNIIANDVNTIKEEVKKGFKTVAEIQLVANTPTEYTLPENAMLFAFQVTGGGVVTVGTSDNSIDDIGDINSLGSAVLQTGFINQTSVWFQSDIDIKVTPIIYQQ